MLEIQGPKPVSLFNFWKFNVVGMSLLKNHLTLHLIE